MLEGESAISEVSVPELTKKAENVVEAKTCHYLENQVRYR